MIQNREIRPDEIYVSVCVMGPLHLDADPKRNIHFGGEFVALRILGEKGVPRDEEPTAMLLPVGAFPDHQMPQMDSTWDLIIERGDPWTPNPSIELTQVS